MSKTIQVVIARDGQVRVDVRGVKGKSCVNYMRLLEDVLDAEIIESAYTPEYDEIEMLVLDAGERHDLRPLSF
jgi:hypothetical protein